MLLQKIFHVNQSVSETKASLANLHLYRRHLDGVNKALITADGVAQFDFVASNGFRGHFVAVELPTDEENQLLFQTTAGNVEISGLLEFFEIRPGLTEVQLTADYTINSPVHSFLDGLTSGFERFVNRQLRRLQAAMDGTPLPASSRKSRSKGFAAQLPQLAH